MELLLLALLRLVSIHPLLLKSVRVALALVQAEFLVEVVVLFLILFLLLLHLHCIGCEGALLDVVLVEGPAILSLGFFLLVVRNPVDTSRLGLVILLFLHLRDP